ncbi:MAG: hypothetical protein KTR20_14735 [Cellvibrionaceae bacterium]|nr:hypothetical protein [Cellvibrionaceae bacterium]
MNRNRIRLILYAAESRGAGDVNTFINASATLREDYSKYYPRDDIIVQGFHSGQELADIINAQAEASIYSLDIVSHGNQGGIHISRTLSPPEESPRLKREWHYRLRGEDQANLDPRYPQTREDAAYMEESMHGLYTSKSVAAWIGRFYNQKLIEEGSFFNTRYTLGLATLEDIVFSRFANNAFIEFHGCRVAEEIPYLNTLFDNFAKDFADQMPGESIVVGHIANNFPDRHPNGNTDDYRHNLVRIYMAAKSTGEPVERWGQTFINSSTPPDTQ